MCGDSLLLRPHLQGQLSFCNSTLCVVGLTRSFPSKPSAPKFHHIPTRLTHPFSLYHPTFLSPNLLPQGFQKIGNLGERIWPGFWLIKDGERGACTQHLQTACCSVTVVCYLAELLASTAEKERGEDQFTPESLKIKLGGGNAPVCHKQI